MPRNVYPNAFVIRPSEDLVKNNLELHSISRELAELYTSENIVINDQQLKAMGGMLWSVLEIQGSFDAAVKEAGAAILPIIVRE